MRHRRSAGRHEESVAVERPTNAPTGETRTTLIARARADGWDVVGHRWIRMSRGAVTIDVWFTDVTGRVVRARRRTADGRIEDLDIVHNRSYRLTLAEVVAQWLGAPAPAAGRSHRALRSSSATHSTEFEAISMPSATRWSRVDRRVEPTTGRVHVPAWVRTDLSPA